eukprot:Em0009g877a
MFPRSSLVRLPWFEKQKIHMVLQDSFQVMSLLCGPNPQRKFLSFRATPKSTFPPCHPFTMSFHPGVRLQIRAHHETSSWLGFQPKVPGAARWPAYTYQSGKDVITPKNGSRKLELLVFLQSKNKGENDICDDGKEIAEAEDWESTVKENRSSLPPCLIHPISLHIVSTVISSPSVNNTLDYYQRATNGSHILLVGQVVQLFLGGVEARRWGMTDGELITVEKVVLCLCNLLAILRELMQGDHVPPVSIHVPKEVTDKMFLGLSMQYTSSHKTHVVALDRGHWIHVTLEGVALDRGHWIHVTLEGVALDRSHWIHVTLEGVALDRSHWIHVTLEGVALDRGHWIHVTLEGVALDRSHWIHVTLEGVALDRGHWIHVTLEGVALDRGHWIHVTLVGVVLDRGHWIHVTLEGVALDRSHWIHVTLEGVALDSCSERKQFEALASTTRNSPVVALQWIAEQLVQRVEEPAVESFLDSCRV